MKRPQNAYMTVLFVLCMTLLLSLCLALIEGVRLNGIKLEAECVTDIALHSVMAEYHREMLEQYNLFVIDSSYGKVECGVENVEKRIEYYLDKNLNCDDVFLSDWLYRDFFKMNAEEVDVTEVSYITDGYGAVFRQCAIEAIKSDVGIGMFEQVLEWMETVEVNGLEHSDIAGQKELADAQLEAWEGQVVEVQKDVWETVIIGNPTDDLEEKRRMGILKQVVEEENLSEAVFYPEDLIASRMSQGVTSEGKAWLQDIQNEDNAMDALMERFLFGEYLLRYMGCFGAESPNDVLQYQVEYLIAGQNNDIENLRRVANRICVIREAANSLYLLGSETKMKEIHLLAEVLCVLMLLPEIVPLMETVLLLGWAYAESVYDVKTLLGGGSVPLIKDDSNWHFGLSAALSGDWGVQEREEEGMSYIDYLRLFILLEDSQVLTLRALNMVEGDMRKCTGNNLFRLDGCIVALRTKVVYESDYGYRYEVIGDKIYN